MAERWILHLASAELATSGLAHDFAQARTNDGRALRMLIAVDEYSRECPANAVARHLRSDDVLEVLAELFGRHGASDHIRSDNSSEFTAKAIRDCLRRLAVKTLDIAPNGPWPRWGRVSREEDSLWENGCNESFNGKLRDGLVNGETFYSQKEAQVLIER